MDQSEETFNIIHVLLYVFTWKGVGGEWSIHRQTECQANAVATTLYFFLFIFLCIFLFSLLCSISQTVIWVWVLTLNVFFHIQFFFFQNKNVVVIITKSSEAFNLKKNSEKVLGCGNWDSKDWIKCQISTTRNTKSV